MTIPSAQLQIDVEERERWRRTLSVTVPAELVRQERERTVKRLAGKLKLPGFRKGKVPAAMVEKQYGPTLQRETLDRVIGEAYRTAITERSLEPISQAEVEDVEYRPESDSDLRFRISFDVRPEIRIERLGGFRVARPDVPVSEAEVDQVMHRLREQAGVWKPAGDPGPALDGDLVTVRIVRLEDGGEPEGEGQGYQLIVGDGDAIPDVEAAIQTLAPGTTGDFTVRFPDDFPNPERRGEEQRLRISVVDRRTKELPALDDAFARAMGEFDSLDALRARVRADLEEEARINADGVATVRLLDAILEANPFEVPRSMVERYIEAVMGDTSKADPEEVERTREQIRPDAELGVKRTVLITRVADAHGLHATPEEFSARIAEMAERAKITPAQARAQLDKAGRLESLERELTDRKVFAFLREKSEIRDEG
jgi:trigger factor